MIFYIILMLLIVQFTGIAQALDYEGFVMNSTIILMGFYFLLYKNKLEINFKVFRKYKIVVLFFLIYLIFGYVNADPSEFLKLLVRIVHNLMAILFMLFNYKEKKQTIINAFWCSSWLMSVYTIIRYIFTYSERQLTSTIPRADALLGNANVLGISILILTLSLFLKKNIKRIDIIFLLLNFVAITLTGSRSTVIILLSILLVFFFKSKIKRIYKLLAFIITSISIYTIYKIMLSINKDFFNRFTNVNSDNFDAGRLDALLAGLKNIYSSFFGVGIGNTANYNGLAAHNFFIEVLAQGGILILPLVLFVFLLQLYLMFFAFKINHSYLLSIAILIFMYSFFSHRVHILLIFTLIMAIFISEYEIETERKLRTR